MKPLSSFYRVGSLPGLMLRAVGSEIEVDRTFPCHPGNPLPVSRKRWLTCCVCATRVRNEDSSFAYDDAYPAARGHHQDLVARCKVRTLERWMAELGIDVRGKTICEIGFGGGACLAALQAAGATVFGTEPVPANREHAQSLGVPAQQLFDVDPLPILPGKIDLWLLQDSFEHVPGPNELVRWMAEQSSTRAQVLLVAPDATSISRKLMGRLWIHEVADHFVHYSRAGLTSIFGRAGFRVMREFRPVKFVSLGMIWSHLRLLTRAPTVAHESRASSFCFRFNLGEMGLLLKRDECC